MNIHPAANIFPAMSDAEFVLYPPLHIPSHCHHFKAVAGPSQ